MLWKGLASFFFTISSLARQFDNVSATSASHVVSAVSASFLDTLSTNQEALFNYGMKGLDANFRAPFLFKSPRYSAWYAVGLLARNEGDDVAVASKMIRDVIKYQFKDPSKLWFGTFKNAPDAPDPGDVYPPKLYTSYDSNQGLFICTSWIIVMEEFKHLLDPTLVALMQESMYNATIGDGYRVGGVDGDNLYPIYSNPWYMRVMSASYVGNMMADSNMTHWGNVWAAQAIAEFDKYDTLSEFNSGTYTGVTLYALSLWGYMPQNSTIRGRATEIIAKTWTTIGNFYNPTLRSLGGPWDRAYGYDMQNYVGILGLTITGIIGGISDGTAPIPIPLIGSEHYGDAAIVALLPIVAKFMEPYIPASAKKALTTLTSGSHFAQAASPPFDNPLYPRNYTSWKENGLSAGAMQIDSDGVVGGPAINPAQFVAASLLWSTGVEGSPVGWMNASLFRFSAISAVASSTNIILSYPPSRAFPGDGIESDVMTFLIGGINGLSLDEELLANGTATLPGIQLKISGNVVNGSRSVTYGTGTINDLAYYNVTYVIPDGLTETPRIVVGFVKL
ncbi:hypothetical protein C8J56DRAFT_860795 [Mycena floridula]|nr:hypothetical protein C8J56DRAFT_860795 [Mycena floridula]